MDSLRGTSVSICTDSGMTSVGRPSGVQASDDDEDSFTPVGKYAKGRGSPSGFKIPCMRPHQLLGQRDKLERVNHLSGSVVTWHW